MTEELESFGNMPEPRMRIELPLAQEGIEAGFPAPNGGYIDGGLDVNEFLVHNPRSTYLYCVHGESMRDAGIMQGDYVLVDSSLEVEDGDIVVASVDGEFTIKELHKGPPLRLVPRNPDFEPLNIPELADVRIIGPVISVVRRYRRD